MPQRIDEDRANRSKAGKGAVHISPAHVLKHRAAAE
jgi:hypothetical protein